ncbi:LpxI family protein [Rhizobium sp. PAMB 3182]
MDGERSRETGRLAIIAGGGLLPVYLAEAAREQGEDPFILALRGESERDWHSFEHIDIDTGNLAGLKKTIGEKGIDRVVMSGSVKRRPDWRAIRPDIKALLNFPRIVRSLASAGDDKLLRLVIEVIELYGCKVIGAQDIAPNLLAEVGPLGAVQPSEADWTDIRQARQAAEELGRLDVGQGAVSVKGRVVALEGAEGTDQMLERVARMRRESRISSRAKGVLVKLCKPQQDLRADLPSIGPSTVANAAAAGLAGIAVEAGRSLVLDRDEMVREADRLGLFVIGFEPTKRKT